MRTCRGAGDVVQQTVEELGRQFGAGRVKVRVPLDAVCFKAISRALLGAC